MAALLFDYEFAEGETLSYSVALVASCGLLTWQFCLQAPDMFAQRFLMPAFRANPPLFAWSLSALAASTAGFILFGRWEALVQAKNMMPGFVTFLFILYAVRNLGEWRRIQNVTLLLLLAMGILGCSQFFFAWPYPVEAASVAALKLDLGGDFARAAARGLTHHPNNFGMMLAPPFAFNLVLLIHRPFKRPPLIALFSVLPAAMALYSTSMKGGLLWVAIATVLAILPRRLLNPVVIIGVVILVSLLVVENALSARSDFGMTIYGRTLLWANGLRHLRYPYTWLLGTDIPRLTMDNRKYAGWEFGSSHMLYLNNALYFGWLPAVLFVGALIWAFVNIIRVAKTSSMLATPARGVLAALVTIAGIGVLEAVSEANRYGTIYIWVGFAAVLPSVLKTVSSTQQRTWSRSHG